MAKKRGRPRELQDIVALENAYTSLPPGRDKDLAWRRLDRAKRYAYGLCADCRLSRMDDSVFCQLHRAKVAGRAAGHGAGYTSRRKFHVKQSGLCPICLCSVSLWDDMDHDHKTKRLRGILHNKCNRFVATVEQLGQEAANRAINYVIAQT